MLLLRIDFNALARGNPFAIFLAIAMAVGISVGPVHDGLSRRDPVAIAMVGFCGLVILIALTIVVYDKRKTLAEEKKRRERSRPLHLRDRPR